ncbi:hypothetical protein ACRRTK_015271 [Alexandromys fortis]
MIVYERTSSMSFTDEFLQQSNNPPPRTTPSCLPGLGSGTQRFGSPQPCFSPFLKPLTGSFL